MISASGVPWHGASISTLVLEMALLRTSLRMVPVVFPMVTLFAETGLPATAVQQEAGVAIVLRTAVAAANQATVPEVLKQLMAPVVLPTKTW